MKLSQKIKHIKRHRKNKHLKDRCETILWLAIMNVKRHNSDRLFIVGPLTYEIIRYYHCVPDNIKYSDFVNATEFRMTVPEDIIKFYKDDELISMFTNPELYMHIDKPIAPAITTFDGVRV